MSQHQNQSKQLSQQDVERILTAINGFIERLEKIEQKLEKVEAKLDTKVDVI